MIVSIGECIEIIQYCLGQRTYHTFTTIINGVKHLNVSRPSMWEFSLLKDKGLSQHNRLRIQCWDLVQFTIQYVLAIE